VGDLPRAFLGKIEYTFNRQDERDLFTGTVDAQDGFVAGFIYRYEGINTLYYAVAPLPRLFAAMQNVTPNRVNR
jgi:hypothetical protein